MKYFLLIVGLAFGYTLQAQSYTVIHVIGKIRVPDQNTYLQRGMKLDAATPLRFESAEAKAAVLATDRGRYILQTEKQGEGSSELAVVLSSVLLPATGRMSTRAGSINNALDFQKQFGEAPIAWCAETLKIPVSQQAFPRNADRFFYVRYIYQNEPVNKRISSVADTLVFEKSSFFTVDDAAVSPEETSDYQLFYYNSADQTSQLITPMQLVPVAKSTLEDLSAGLADLPVEERQAALQELVSSLYGQCTPDQVSAITTSR